MEALVLRRAADEQAKQHFFLPTRLVQLVRPVTCRYKQCSVVVLLSYSWHPRSPASRTQVLAQPPVRACRGACARLLLVKQGASRVVAQ